MRTRSLILVAAVLAWLPSARQPAAAAEPQEIPSGNLMVVQTSSAERWFIVPHQARERSVILITVSDSGDVAMRTQPLPDRHAPPPDDPDDPDDPPPADLATLIARWADEIDDAATRAKLAAVYQFSLRSIDSGSITSVDELKGFQAQADTVVLGDQAEKWTPFLQKLKAHLDAHVGNDLASYRAAWEEIVSGLAQGIHPAVLEYLLHAHESEWGQP